jgi:hypothetical protein
MNLECPKIGKRDIAEDSDRRGCHCPLVPFAVNEQIDFTLMVDCSGSRYRKISRQLRWHIVEPAAMDEAQICWRSLKDDPMHRAGSPVSRMT